MARYLVIGLLALPSALCFALIPWTAPLTVLIIFKTLLPAFFGGFLVFGFSHYFFIRFKLLNDQQGESYEIRRSLQSESVESENLS